MIAFSELRAQAWRIGTIAFGVLAVALLVTCLIFWNRATRANVRADAEAARAQALQGQLQAVTEARDREHQAAIRANAIAGQYEQDKKDAQDLANRLAADVRAGRVQLQKRWACDAGEVAGTASEPDASADDRAASAARIVQAARDADSQIRGLQSLIQSDRGVTND